MAFFPPPWKSNALQPLAHEIIVVHAKIECSQEEHYPPPGTANTIAPGKRRVRLHGWSGSSLWLLKEVGRDMDGLMHRHYPQGESR